MCSQSACDFPMISTVHKPSEEPEYITGWSGVREWNRHTVRAAPFQRYRAIATDAGNVDVITAL